MRYRVLFDLLWTFMGASYGYNLFTGAAEMIGGALLIIPPLATLGALITIAAMGNVSLLNMTYDVPSNCSLLI